jgi:chromosome segregation ATPase
VDRANAAVRRLETENAEIRAEMEASKLSASESVTTCLEVAKREKKCLKRLLAWEKQKTKLQAEIADEKEKIKELQRCLGKIEQAQKEAEVRYTSIYLNPGHTHMHKHQQVFLPTCVVTVSCCN